MKTLIRSSHKVEITLFILLNLFSFSVLFSYEMFDVRFHNPEHLENSWPGMVLIGVAAILAVMILWEELLFQVKVKEINGGLIFRSHRKKFRIQLLLFCGIPAIFTFIYFEYDVKLSHLMIWAFFCIVLPAIEVVMSGINNHRYFLKLTNRMIKFKNHEKEGTYATADLRNITIIKESTKRSFSLKKIELSFSNNNTVLIDLDEMNLHIFYESIYTFIKTHYKHLLIEQNPVTSEKPATA
jgi:hypothetical protein